MTARQRAATLTQRLLAFSRQSPLSPSVLNLNCLVASMSELLRRTLGEPVMLETVLAGGLWSTHADPNQLENAIVNLAVNARDAMPDGGKLTIETANAHLDDRYVGGSEPGLLQPGQYVMVAVSDVGAGMDAAKRSSESSILSSPPSRWASGTGLGLSMVYGFAKQSGGHVRIYSEPGAGHDRENLSAAPFRLRSLIAASDRRGCHHDADRRGGRGNRARRRRRGAECVRMRLRGPCASSATPSVEASRRGGGAGACFAQLKRVSIWSLPMW